MARIRREDTMATTSSSATGQQLVPFEQLHFYDCKVTGAGAEENGVVNIRLHINGVVDERWFTCLPQMGDRVLQVGLQAVVTGLPCGVALTGPGKEGNQIYRLHLFPRD
jgi:hypothetical protein